MVPFVLYHHQHSQMKCSPLVHLSDCVPLTLQFKNKPKDLKGAKDGVSSAGTSCGSRCHSPQAHHPAAPAGSALSPHITSTVIPALSIQLSPILPWQDAHAPLPPTPRLTNSAPPTFTSAPPACMRPTSPSYFSVPCLGGVFVKHNSCPQADNSGPLPAPRHAGCSEISSQVSSLASAGASGTLTPALSSVHYLYTTASCSSNTDSGPPSGPNLVASKAAQVRAMVIEQGQLGIQLRVVLLCPGRRREQMTGENEVHQFGYQGAVLCHFLRRLSCVPFCAEEQTYCTVWS